MASLSLSSLTIPTIGYGSPSSQKASDRPISFVLVDNTTGSTYTNSLSLLIRPEELTRTETSRLQVQQTLGGAWADDFGPGLTTINISGTTGWRGANGIDGVAAFAALKKQVYTDWHARRNAARAAGKDPSGVQLTFADALDATTDIVAPINFTLRRSKSRPLLMQFQISMISIALAKPASISLLGGFTSLLQKLGLTSLANSISTIASAISSVQSWVTTNLIAPVSAFLRTAVTAFNAVVGVINAGTGVIGSVLGTAESIAQVGMNAFHTLAAIAALPAAVAAQTMAVASEFENVFCVLKNALNKSSVYQDLDSLFGASNCSSTSGGHAASTYTIGGTNPFYDVVGTPTAAPISVSPTANTAMQTVNNTDPVLSPLSSTAIGNSFTVISTGIKVAPIQVTPIQ